MDVWQQVTEPETGRVYYLNSQTNETSWVKPAGSKGAPLPLPDGWVEKKGSDASVHELLLRLLNGQQEARAEREQLAQNIRRLEEKIEALTIEADQSAEALERPRKALERRSQIHPERDRRSQIYPGQREKEQLTPADLMAEYSVFNTTSVATTGSGGDASGSGGECEPPDALADERYLPRSHGLSSNRSASARATSGAGGACASTR